MTEVTGEDQPQRVHRMRRDRDGCMQLRTTLILRRRTAPSRRRGCKSDAFSGHTLRDASLLRVRVPVVGSIPRA